VRDPDVGPGANSSACCVTRKLDSVCRPDSGQLESDSQPFIGPLGGRAQDCGAGVSGRCCAYNEAIARIDHPSADQPSLPDLRAYCANLAVARRPWIDALDEITWSAERASDAKALIEAEKATEEGFKSCAEAADTSDWFKMLDCGVLINRQAHEAARLVRMDLGLEPVSAPNDSR
jgi:hypothetical protein